MNLSIRQIAAQIARSPLLHFAISGALIFGAYRISGAPPVDQTIVVRAEQRNGMLADFQRRNGRKATADEAAGLITQYVNEEVLVREALARGLEQNDLIVRRRLIQKMEFLTSDLAPVPEPTEGELQTYLDTHPDRYLSAAQLTMTHVYASSEKHAGKTRGVAESWTHALQSGKPHAGLGAPFVRGRTFTGMTEPALAGIFGPALANAAFAVDEGTWSAPLESAYGFHVIRVTDRKPAARLSLASARESVRKDWTDAKRAELNDAYLAQLRSRYDVQIESETGGTAEAAP